jgi:hypothetical protein
VSFRAEAVKCSSSSVEGANASQRRAPAIENVVRPVALNADFANNVTDL